MAKYRSKVNYKTTYDGDKQGFNLGIDGSIYLRKESTPLTFNAPRIGTQGKSTSDTAPGTDLTSQSDTNLRVAVDGGPVTAVTLSLGGNTTGTLIAAELESKINLALAAAGLDSRVWVEFAGGLYVVHSQKTGTTSAVVITDGLTANVADYLKLGTGQGGVEVVGTNDQDFLLYTTGGPKFAQPIESNAHRSGRFHSGIIKKKKTAEFSISTYINMSGTAGDSLDTAVKLLWEQLLGTETVNPSTSIVYTQGLPNFYCSLVRVSTIFGEYFNGAYVKDMKATGPGDGPATCEWSGMAATRSIAGIAKVPSLVTASATVGVVTDQEKRFSEGAYVMTVDTDGRTILAGADGSLSVLSISDVGNTVTLSSAVTIPANGYLVPWHPGAVQETGRDNIYTDLVGTLKLNAGGSSIDVTEWSVDFKNDHSDLNKYFGRDHNRGFAADKRMTITLAVNFDLSNENFADVVQTQNFAGYAPEIVLGALTGRYLKITAPKWVVEVPPIEVPDSGLTPISLTGVLYQSTPGAADPIAVGFY